MKNILLILNFFFVLLISAQPPSRFYASIGGDGDDVGYSVKVTLDKQYIVAGSTSSYGNHGNTDMYLTKIDTFGVPLWQKFIGGAGNDVGKSVIQLPDSGYVIAGFTNSFGMGGYDGYLVKTDKNGNTLWQTTYGGTDWDFGSDVVLAPDGTLIMVGNTTSFGNGKKDGFVAKYDLAGNLLLQKTFGGVENEELRSVIVTNDNFLATVGYTESKGDLNGDSYFLKLNLNGDTLFTVTFGGPYKDFSNDLVQKANDEYILVGAKTFSANAKSEAYMYSLFPSGQFSWYANIYDGPNDDVYVSCANSTQSPSLTAYVKTRATSGFKLQADLRICSSFGNCLNRINASGGTEDEIVYAVEATPDKGYVCVGSTLSFGSAGSNIYFIKVDSTIENYSSVVGIRATPDVVKPAIVYQDDLVNLLFENNDAARVSVYDITGSLVNEFFIHGQKQLQVNTSGYSSSIYILRITFQNGSMYSEKFIHK